MEKQYTTFRGSLEDGDQLHVFDEPEIVGSSPNPALAVLEELRGHVETIEAVDGMRDGFGVSVAMGSLHESHPASIRTAVDMLRFVHQDFLDKYGISESWPLFKELLIQTGFHLSDLSPDSSYLSDIRLSFETPVTEGNEPVMGSKNYFHTDRALFADPFGRGDNHTQVSSARPERFRAVINWGLSTAETETDPSTTVNTTGTRWIRNLDDTGVAIHPDYRGRACIIDGVAKLEAVMQVGSPTLNIVSQADNGVMRLAREDHWTDEFKNAVAIEQVDEGRVAFMGMNVVHAGVIPEKAAKLSVVGTYQGIRGIYKKRIEGYREARKAALQE